MNEGYIKLYRKLRDNPFYTNSVAVHVWVECLMRAAYTPRTLVKGREAVEIKPGQFVMGRTEFGEKTGLSPSTVLYWLQKFKVDSMIDIKTTNKGTVVSIKNWSQYSEVDSTSDNKKTAEKQRKNTSKKVKKDNISNEIGSETHPEGKKLSSGKTSYGNEHINQVMGWFTQTYGFSPADKQPRHFAYNLVQKISKLVKTRRPDLPPEEHDARVAGILGEFLKWVTLQRWSEGVQTVGAVYRHFSEFCAKVLGERI